MELTWTWYVLAANLYLSHARDEEKIMKACYWPNEVFEPCFAGCAEITCDNPQTHLRPCYPYCEAGCVCEDPYVRDDRTHQCVLPADCTVTQLGIPVRPPKQSKQINVKGKGKKRARREIFAELFPDGPIVYADELISSRKIKRQDQDCDYED